MARVLAISSLVARGHVGLSAMVPALQALGHDVTALPTILLSHHPGHPHAAGERVAPATLTRMLDGLAANGWLAEVDAVVTGYLPSAEHVAVATAAIARIRTAAPAALVLVDAVLGDLPQGLYIAADAAAAVRACLAPAADIVKGNAFEVGWLAGRGPLATADDVAAVARGLGVRALLATSLHGGASGRLRNVLVEAGGPGTTIEVAELAGVPKGTGDLLAGLLIGHRLAGCSLATQAHPEDHSRRYARALGKAVRDLQRIVEVSLDAGELRLVPALPRIAAG